MQYVQNLLQPSIIGTKATCLERLSAGEASQDSPSRLPSRSIARCSPSTMRPKSSGILSTAPLPPPFKFNATFPPQTDPPKKPGFSADPPRARHKTYQRGVFKNRLTFELRHTTHKPYDGEVARALPTYSVYPVKNLPLGLLTYRAGVKNYEICRLRRVA